MSTRRPVGCNFSTESFGTVYTTHSASYQYSQKYGCYLISLASNAQPHSQSPRSLCAQPTALSAFARRAFARWQLSPVSVCATTCDHVGHALAMMGIIICAMTFRSLIFSILTVCAESNRYHQPKVVFTFADRAVNYRGFGNRQFHTLLHWVHTACHDRKSTVRIFSSNYSKNKFSPIARRRNVCARTREKHLSTARTAEKIDQKADSMKINFIQNRKSAQKEW